MVQLIISDTIIFTFIRMEIAGTVPEYIFYLNDVFVYIYIVSINTLFIYKVVVA
jgi:hypothetical protein